MMILSLICLNVLSSCSVGPSHYSSPVQTTASEKTWELNSQTASTFNIDSNIDITATSCQLKIYPQSDLTFNEGSLKGLSYATLSDGSQGLKLADDGNCNGLLTNCREISPDLTNDWNNLIGYWKLNDSTTAITDSSPLALNPGVASGVSLGVTGKLNKAIRINSGGYILVSSKESIKTAHFTFSFWAKKHSLHRTTISVFKRSRCWRIS